MQESVKDGKPKFFLNNAGEVIRRVGKLKCSSKIIFLVGILNKSLDKYIITC